MKNEKADLKDIQKILPLGENVLVERYPPEDKSAGGLELPSVSKTAKQGIGWIVAISPEIPNPNCEVGDTVVFLEMAAEELNPAQFGGWEAADKATQYCFVNCKNIHAKAKKGAGK